MSENQTEEVQNQDGTPELTAVEIWAQAGATETEKVTSEPENQEQETVEVEEPVAEGPENESTDGYEVAEVEATPEEPKHDYEKRYKDLEREFHRRNEEQSKLRDEYMTLQIQNLKLNQDLQKPKTEARKEEPKVNPYALTDDEKKVAEEFPDILAVAQKMAMEEVNKMASKNVFDPMNQQQETLKLMQDRIAQYDHQQKALTHQQLMRQYIGEDFRDIDKSDEFYDFVMASPIREQAMTQTLDGKDVAKVARDHIAVMHDFLSSPIGKSKFRPEPVAETKPVSEQKQQRRKAASGLVKNATPKPEKRIEDMTPDELWDSIPSQV